MAGFLAANDTPSISRLLSLVMKIDVLFGVRPNFMKMAPLLRALDARDGVATVLVHTGQHYDKSSLTSFLKTWT